MNHRSGGPPPPPPHTFKRGRPGDNGPGIPVRPPFDPRFGGREDRGGRDLGRGGGRFGGRGRGPPQMGRVPPMMYGRDRGPQWPMGRDMFPPERERGHPPFREGPPLNMGRGHPRVDPSGNNFFLNQRPPPPPPQNGDMAYNRGREHPPIMNQNHRVGMPGGLQFHQGMQPMQHQPPTMHMGMPQMPPQFHQNAPQGMYIHSQGRPHEHGGQSQHHQMPGPTATHVLVSPVPSPASAYSQEQIDAAWTEHTAPNSMKYYHNSILQESTYTMPSVLAGRVQLTSSIIDGVDAKSQLTWIEYSDPTSGKTYYSNGVTTTWEKPGGFGFSSEINRAAQGGDEKEPPTKKKKEAVKKEGVFTVKAEAQAAFKGLLLAKGITPTNKWKDVVKICSADSTYDSCQILSLGEKKQALAEYQTKRANELKNLEREERKRAKDAFVDLLSETLNLIANFNPLTTRLRDVHDTLVVDDRFQAVEDEGTRESLFVEFCEEVRKREERKKRNKKREMKESFFAVLKEHEDNGKLTFASTWSSFLASLDEGEINDPRFLASPLMSDSDRELYFSDYVIELQAAEDEKRRRIREARERAETAQREAFCETLRRLAANEMIVPYSRWSTIEELVHREPAFGPVQEQDRNAPRDLFEDFISEWNSRYQHDRSFMRRILSLQKRNGQTSKIFTTESTYDEFTERLLSSSAGVVMDYQESRLIINTEDPLSSAKIFFNELTKGISESPAQHHSSRALAVDDSSIDEGEIVEDGEIED